MKGYAHAWHQGYTAWHRYGVFTIRPFWRGRKYRKAWRNGFHWARAGYVRFGDDKL